MDMHELKQMRRQKDDFFKKHPQSPLTPAQQAKFTGLSYYEPNPELVFEVEIEVFDGQQQILMQTNQNELRPFFRYGMLTVAVGSEQASLTIYRSPDGYFFLPFVDGAAGTETYSAGRYLDLEPLDESTFVVDFNLAYNPYCAYNDLFVCPITPKENRISMVIQAGEKLPDSRWVDKL